MVLVAPAMAIGSGYYRPLLEELRARGWEAEALPRRGHEADGVRASRSNDWGYADEIDEMAAAVARWRAADPGRPVLVLGHSMGGQMAVGHQLTRDPADGVVLVGASLPHHVLYPRRGPGIVALAALVPAVTAVVGHHPRPLFGGPGGRTLMREWAWMALTGRPPYPTRRGLAGPVLSVTLEGDRMAPERANRVLATRWADDDARVTSWTYRTRDVPAGGSNDHVRWVRSPGPVVDRLVTWWEAEGAERPDAAATGHPAGAQPRKPTWPTLGEPIST
ncbi:serine aminopeptidase domain-containing protein [Nocardioides sp. CPCC 205120]|uniref:serine aminopeptidase domain-containing protein n=1 Tax=Nocardioides sp. CPCC 205120 TaxID=3406462 RepID=UPI003B50A556